MITAALSEPARVWLRRGALDRSLARGADPSATRELSRRARQLTLELADDLAGDDQVSPRGIALVERLLTDGTSPVYTSSPEGSLHGALTHARAALHLS